MKKYFAYAFILIGLLTSVVSCTPIIRVSINSFTQRDFTSQSSFLAVTILLAFASLFTLVGVLMASRHIPSIGNPEISKPASRVRTTLLCLSPLTLFAGLPMAHLLIPLWVWKRSALGDPALAAEAKRMLNFQITWTLFAVVGLMLCVVLVGLFMLAILLIFHLAVTLSASWKSWQGHHATYPMSMSFIR